jgi:serine/threonine protein kinase
VIRRSNKKTYALKIQKVPSQEDLEEELELNNMHEITTISMQTEVIIGEYIKKLGLGKYVLTPNRYYHLDDYYAIEYDYINGFTLDAGSIITHKDLLASNMLILYNVLLILHANGIYHNDIKPENILFDQKSNSFVLIDLGLACSQSCAGKQFANCKYLGDVRYIDPKFKGIVESHLTYENRAKNDIYALFETYNDSFKNLFGFGVKISPDNIATLSPNYGLIESAKLWLYYLDNDKLSLINSILSDNGEGADDGCLTETDNDIMKGVPDLKGAVDNDILNQFKSKACYDKYTKNHNNQKELKKLINKRYPDCTNRTNIHGVPIGEFSPKSITKYKEGSNNYCFTRMEVADMRYEKNNPYTGKKLNNKFFEKAKIQKISVPLRYQILELNEKSGKCPISRSRDKNVVFTYGKPYDFSYKQAGNDGYTMETDGVNDYIYKVWLKDKNDLLFSKSKGINPGNVIKSEKISYGNVFGESPSEIPDNLKVIVQGRSLKILKDYMERQYRDITIENLKDLKNMKGIRSDKPVIVYRGLSFSNEVYPDGWLAQIATSEEQDRFIDNFRRPIDVAKAHKGPLKVGDIFKLQRDGLVESWTTNPCVALSYATTGDMGVVLRYEAAPDEVIMDARYVKNILDLYSVNQAEVILARKRNEATIDIISLDGDNFAEMSYDSSGHNPSAKFESDKTIKSRNVPVNRQVFEPPANDDYYGYDDEDNY